jgi:hypothetical protein
MTVNRKRFMLLAVALVALNSFFWVAQSGLAKDPRSLIGDLFGQRLIRAEVLVQTPTGTADYRVDRGVLVASTPTTITLRELNGELVTIDLAPDARVDGASGRLGALAQLMRKRMRVTVVRDANGPVSLIQVDGSGGK